MEMTAEFLMHNRHCIFVFGDNLKRTGKRGAAKFRDFSNTYGFVTKKKPSNERDAFFTQYEYRYIYRDEIRKLKAFMNDHPDCYFYISKLGAGLANRNNIFEEVIQPSIKNDLIEFQDRIVWMF